MEFDDFKQWLYNMQPSVFGYSILEADGAFVSSENLRLQTRIGEPYKVRGGKALEALLSGSEEETAAVKNLHNWLWNKGILLGECVLRLSACGAKEFGERERKAVLEALGARGLQLAKRFGRVQRDSWLLIEGKEWDLEGNRVDRRYAAHLRAGQIEVRRVEMHWWKCESDCWIVTSGNTGVRLELIKGGSLQEYSWVKVQRTMALIEERTCVIRFLTDLRIPSGRGFEPFATDVNKLGVEEHGKLGSEIRADDDFSEAAAARRAWDSVTVLSQYFVHQLCERVGVEDEIWMTVAGRSLWKWRKGRLVEVSELTPRKLGGGPAIEASSESERLRRATMTVPPPLPLAEALPPPGHGLRIPLTVQRNVSRKSS